MKKAIGLIETKGLAAAAAAADKAVKSAKIILEGKEITGTGYVTICISGELAEIEKAIPAGTEAARCAGEVISFAVISEPDESLSLLLPFARYRALTGAQNEKKLSTAERFLTVEAEIDAAHSSFQSSKTSEAKREPSGERDETKKRKISKKNIIPKPAVKKNMPTAPAAEIIRPVEAPSEFSPEGVVNDTITRLREEALGKTSVSPVAGSVSNKEPAGDDLNTLNVHQLRKLARSIPEFPIFGRKISKANRDELLKMFNGLNR